MCWGSHHLENGTPSQTHPLIKPLTPPKTKGFLEWPSGNSLSQSCGADGAVGMSNVQMHVQTQRQPNNVDKLQENKKGWCCLPTRLVLTEPLSGQSLTSVCSHIFGRMGYVLSMFLRFFFRCRGAQGECVKYARVTTGRFRNRPHPHRESKEIKHVNRLLDEEDYRKQESKAS
jgi:hypothetical protein